MKISVIKGDITEAKVDAVVNAANSSLMGGGGVDGAIHRKGGKEILEECIKIRIKQGGCNVGEAVITTAGNLPSKFVIHTVGPVWIDGKHDEEHLLSQCYSNCLKFAMEYNLKSIAFPNISTGIYKFPQNKAAKIVFDILQDFVNSNTHDLEEIQFVCFEETNYLIYKNIFKNDV